MMIHVLPDAGLVALFAFMAKVTKIKNKVSMTWLLAVLIALVLSVPTIGDGSIELRSGMGGDDTSTVTTSTVDAAGTGLLTSDETGSDEYHGGGGSAGAGGRSWRLPRILTVLTTYSKRSPFIKAYKERAWDREDGYKPPLFVVSNEEDPDPENVVDFRVGRMKRHRSLAAVAEACRRYKGTFDWLAVGDDDTVFMYNRARAFLRHIDHTQPVAIGRVDGLTRLATPVSRKECYTPEAKRDSSNVLASNGCCEDFTHPCKVHPYPLEKDEALFAAKHRNFVYQDYGPGGLFWPYGGTGTFISAGLAIDVIGGAEGWDHCARIFPAMLTDVKLAQCIKLHGYSMGRYPDGFSSMNTSDPVQIRSRLGADCQIMGVHLGMKHLKDGTNYTSETFGDTVAAIRDEDVSWMKQGRRHLKDLCPESSAALSKWKP